MTKVKTSFSDILIIDVFVFLTFSIVFFHDSPSWTYWPSLVVLLCYFFHVDCSTCSWRMNHGTVNSLGRWIGWRFVHLYTYFNIIDRKNLLSVDTNIFQLYLGVPGSYFLFDFCVLIMRTLNCDVVKTVFSNG